MRPALGQGLVIISGGIDLSVGGTAGLGPGPPHLRRSRLGLVVYAIAAVVLGVCSLRGVVGSVSGILVGAALMRLITNGINLLGISTHWELTVIGLVIAAAAGD